MTQPSTSPNNDLQGSLGRFSLTSIEMHNQLAAPPERFVWQPEELRIERARERILPLLANAKRLAQEYYRLTGKPLGITGEVAEYEAARLLSIELTPARQAGYDAIEQVQGVTRRVQIKGRYIPVGASRSQRVGAIDIRKDFDSVLLVILDDEFNAAEMWEAERANVVAALTAPGSKARNERFALAVSKFKGIGRLRWSAAAHKCPPRT